MNAMNTRKLTGILLIAAFVMAILYLTYRDTYPKTGTATLSWAANTEKDLAGYKIYYGTALRTDKCPPGGYPDKIDVGKTDNPLKPSYKLENLQNGKTYYFSVTSYDTSGNESCFSAEMNKHIVLQ